VVALLDGAVFSVDRVQSFESVLGENDESAKVTTRSKLEKVKSFNVAGVNAWEVASGSLDVLVLVAINNKRAFSELEAAVSLLVGTSTSGLADSHSVEIVTSTNSEEGLEHSLGRFSTDVVNDKRKLVHVVNVVASSLNKRSNCTGGEGRSDGVSLLTLVDLAVPLPPGLKRSEHTTLTAHVTEGTLTGAGSTRAADTGDTSDGTTSAP
jgi:hypothetical protein